MLVDSLQSFWAILPLLAVLVMSSQSDPVSAPRVFLSFKGKRCVNILLFNVGVDVSVLCGCVPEMGLRRESVWLSSGLLNVAPFHLHCLTVAAYRQSHFFMMMVFCISEKCFYLMDRKLREEMKTCISLQSFPSLFLHKDTGKEIFSSRIKCVLYSIGWTIGLLLKKLNEILSIIVCTGGRST